MTFFLTMTFAVSNLCRGKPSPEFNLVQPFIAPLILGLQYLAHNEDTRENPESPVDICWSLCYLSDGAEECAQALLDAGVAPLMMGILARFKDHPRVVLPAIRTFGNYVAGTHAHTDVVLQAGLLNHLHDFLDHQCCCAQRARGITHCPLAPRHSFCQTSLSL